MNNSPQLPIAISRSGMKGIPLADGLSSPKAGTKTRLTWIHWRKARATTRSARSSAPYNSVSPVSCLRLPGPPTGYADRLRFSWALGPASEADMIKGTDFAVVEGGRLRSVTGFLDKVLAGA